MTFVRISIAAGYWPACIRSLACAMSRSTAGSPERLHSSHSPCSAKPRTKALSSRSRSCSRPASRMVPWLAIQTTASARVAVSGLARSRSACSRFSGAGNAAHAAAVSSAKRTIRRGASSFPMARIYSANSLLKGTRMTIRSAFRPIVLSLLVAAPGAVFAAADTNSSGGPVDPVLERAAQASDRKDWAGAQAILKDAVARNPGNAEYHNMYAYNLRKGANPDMSLVFKHYNEALRLDPRHRGANEYLGEAYLMVGNVAKAKEQLGVLDKLCLLSCREYTDLKNSIAAYEAKKK